LNFPRGWMTTSTNSSRGNNDAVQPPLWLPGFNDLDSQLTQLTSSEEDVTNKEQDVTR